MTGGASFAAGAFFLLLSKGLPPSPQTEAPPLLRGRSCGRHSAQLPVANNTPRQPHTRDRCVQVLQQVSV